MFALGRPIAIVLLPILTVAFAAGTTASGSDSPAGRAVQAPVARARVADRPTNVVVILFDDLGYGDLGCYGGAVPTSRMDRLAREGVRFTDFYAAAPFCSPSRAALLTGCYPQRVSIPKGLGPYRTMGLNPAEFNLADLLSARGYQTACIGKWHLGDAREFLPCQNGFDVFFGLPYSHDVTTGRVGKEHYPPLPLYDQNEVVEHDPDLAPLTRRFTDRAIRFVDTHANEPFFLFLAYTAPHTPLHVGDEFRETSGRGLYGDILLELDASVGRLLNGLQEHGLTENTLVVVTSDNGPAEGSAGPLRDGKGSSYEGGHRVPCILSWPGRLAPGVDHGIATLMDLYPTIAELTAIPLGDGADDDVQTDWRKDARDGRSLLPRLDGHITDATGETFAYYHRYDLRGIRQGRWKLMFPHEFTSHRAGMEGRNRVAKSLFDLEADPGETTDLASQHPDVVAQLETLAVPIREALGDTLTGVTGSEVRPAGSVPPWAPMGRRLQLAIAGAVVLAIVLLVAFVRFRGAGRHAASSARTAQRTALVVSATDESAD